MTTSQAIELDEASWETLVDSVLSGSCTPFLGAGVAVPHLPSGAQLAKRFANQYGYPLPDPWNLTRVGQYLATLHDPGFAKRKIAEYLKRLQDGFLQQQGSPPENFVLLASLALPIYVTTNYDNLLELALVARGRAPYVQTARWNELLIDDLGGFPEHEPTAEQPVLFHMHGDLRNINSLVLTEDDYIDFTVTLALRDEQAVLYHRVRRALSRTNLLFVGYSLEDWNFRVLMRYLLRQQRIATSEQPLSLSIQLEDPDMDEESRLRASQFLERYLSKSSITLHWCDASEFLVQLEQRVAERRA